MAYVDDEELQKQQADQQQQPQGAERVLSGESSDVNTATQGAGGGASAAPAGAKAAGSGTGWTNLQSYVTANQGADQAMGEGVKGKVAEKATAADQVRQSCGTQANQAIQSGTVNDQGVIQGLKSDPTKVSKTAYEQQANAVYQGPKTYNEGDLGQGYQAAQQATQSVAGTADKAKDYESRMGLLDDTYGRPSYTAGEKRLDSFILGAGDGGKQALNDIQQSYGQGSQFTKGWDDLLGQVTGNIGQAQQTTAKTAADTRQALGDATTATTAKIQAAKSALDSETGADRQVYDQAQFNLRPGSSAVEHAKAFASMGVDPATGEWMLSQGVSPSQIFQLGQQRKLGDLVGDQDAASYNALMDLGGGKSDYDFSKSGGSHAAFNVNNNVVGAGQSAAAMQKTLDAKLKAQQAARDNELGQLQSGFVSMDPAARKQTLDKLGIAGDMMTDAERYGIDPSKFLKAGRKLDMGDVASDQDRAGWSSLMQTLGIAKPKTNFADAGDEGGAYTFDRDGFYKAINAAQANASLNSPLFKGGQASAAPQASAPAASGGGGSPLMAPAQAAVDYASGKKKIKFSKPKLG